MNIINVFTTPSFEGIDFDWTFIRSQISGSHRFTEDGGTLQLSS